MKFLAKKKLSVKKDISSFADNKGILIEGVKLRKVSGGALVAMSRGDKDAA